MQRVQQPPQERYRIPLLGHSKLALATLGDLLQKLVRRDLRLEQPRVPYPLCQTREPFDEFGRSGLHLQLRRARREEIVTDGRDVEQEVDDDVHIVVGADIVQSDVTGDVGLGGERVG